MKTSLIVALSVVASLAAPSKRQAELDSHLKTAAARGIDQSAIDAIKKIFLDRTTTVNQKQELTDDYVKTLSKEQQAKIDEFAKEVEERQAVFLAKVKRQFEAAGGAANKIGQQMLAIFQDENLTSEQMTAKIADIVKAAPDAVKEQLKELGEQFNQLFMDMFAN